MDGRATRLFTIPPGVSFVDALAAALLAETGGDPLVLARYTILLPTRRARRALDEAFLRQSDGRPLLLPRTLPLGDLDPDDVALAGGEDGAAFESVPGLADLPPPIPALRRQLLLTQAIQAAGRATGEPLSVDQAARLAAELARLLDQVQTEQQSFDRLRDLVPEDYAGHWQITLRFLSVLTEEWPKILAAEGCLDPADRRNRVLAMQAEAWRRAPPPDPVIAAGSTGSIPATAALLEVIADLPAGRVVLPGLDRALDDETWDAVLADPAHPQHGLGLLLRRLDVPPRAVRLWPCQALPSTLPSRARLISEALRPAATTERWRALVGAAADTEALAGVTRIDCPGPQEEAGVIALLLRAAVEQSGRRAALVTPDRALARRVAAELRRWDIEVDDSAGQPLDQTPPGVFLRLTAEMLAEELAPIPLLAALKHPLAAGGREVGAFRAWVRAFERTALRGPRPAPGFGGLRQALSEEQAARSGHRLDKLAALAAPLERLIHRPQAQLADLIDAHVTFAEGLTASATETGASRLWRDDAGEAAANFIADLRQAASGFAPMPGDRYPALLSGLLAAQVVRPRYGRHPRLAIWGPLEARLQHADLLVLGGLNEGTWPADTAADPWLSRPMRRDFGLPAPERRIGLAAHDFAQAMGAPEVVLTRALRVEGTPTVPSRWLLRLDGLLRSMGLDPERLHGGQWLDWQMKLDRPAFVRPVAPPAPCPPVKDRPRSIRVTEVEQWRRDPYAIYAKRILKLSALEPIDAEPGAADRGTWIHHALERFVVEHPQELPADALDRLLAIGRQEFGTQLSRPAIAAFWWPRFEQIARWFVENERQRRPTFAAVHAETKGQLEFAGPEGAFVLTATADRIERGGGGRLVIVDYKTGGLPKLRDIEFGFAPQLPLEAAIARAGGFAGIEPADVGALQHWRLTGGNPAAEIEPVKGEPQALADAALAGLRRLVAAFDLPETSYQSVPDPEMAPRFSDYAHLARIKEWSVGAPGDDE
ncbi:MAG: double-strand break repair protein AddB [Dongiaceae bacterium]